MTYRCFNIFVQFSSYKLCRPWSYHLWHTLCYSKCPVSEILIHTNVKWVHWGGWAAAACALAFHSHLVLSHTSRERKQGPLQSVQICITIPAVCRNVSSRNLDLYKALASVDICPSQRFPGASAEGLEPVHRLQLVPQPALGSTWCKGRWDTSWVPQHMLLDPTVPTKAFLFVDKCWILNV